MKKFVIGGSPCTKWSIAQKNGRETEPSGIGWELFSNYRIAVEKFQPDYFLYENNQSASQPIKDRIILELGVPLVNIDSALVSAQTRKRFYACNWSTSIPKDRGIVLHDVLEYGIWQHNYKLSLSRNEMEYMCRGTNGRYSDRWTYLVKPGERDKSCCMTANIHKGVPYNICAEPVRIGTIESDAKNKEFDSKQYRVYAPYGKATTLCGQGGGVGAKTGLYATQVFDVVKMADGTYSNREDPLGRNTIYKVENGLLTFANNQYPIRLTDGFYIIRKLTVTECCRLQTLPDNYVKAVSPTQGYKGLGNGWTAEVIIHLLNGALKDVPRDEEIVVLSMYDGIGTGRYCFDKLGFTNIRYYAYEIDPYAKKVALDNYPDIIQCGDAFDVRDPMWSLF